MQNKEKDLARVDGLSTIDQQSELPRQATSRLVRCLPVLVAALVLIGCEDRANRPDYLAIHKSEQRALRQLCLDKGGVPIMPGWSLVRCDFPVKH